MGIFSFLEKRVSMAELQTELSEVASHTAQQMMYFKELALHIAISYIANTISKCEFKVYENGEEVRNELYYMLNVNPNPNQSSSQFLNALVTRYYRKGESLVFPDSKRNRLYVADGFSVEEKPLAENIFSSISIENEALRKKYKASDVFYFRLDDVSIKRLIDGTFEQYGAIMNAAIDGFIRRNGKKYKLILDQYKAGDAEFNQIYNDVLKKNLATFVQNANAVYPQFKGTNLEEFDKSAAGNYGSSADVIAIRKEVFDVIAQGFKIPIPLLYGNITSLKENTTQFLTYCVEPLASLISEEFTRKMYPYSEWKKGSRVVLDTSNVRHIDLLDAANSADKLIASGVCNVDEVRSILGFEPLNTEFSMQHFVTKNYETAENALKQTDETTVAPDVENITDEENGKI